MSEKRADSVGGERYPIPETRRALLPSEGLDPSVPTWHEWVATEERPATYEGLRTFVHRFRCELTGAIRVWGVQDVAVDGKPLHAPRKRVAP